MALIIGLAFMVVSSVLIFTADDTWLSKPKTIWGVLALEAAGALFFFAGLFDLFLETLQ